MKISDIKIFLVQGSSGLEQTPRESETNLNPEIFQG